MLLIVVFGIPVLLSVVAAQPQVSLGDSVAFTAALTGDTIVRSGETIRYSFDITNYGGGYDNRTGIFTSPRPGLYLFLIYGTTPDGGGYFRLQLRVNGQDKVSSYGFSLNNNDSGGNSAVVYLNKNDQVYVTADAVSTLIGRPFAKYCTFTGILVGVPTYPVI